MLVVPLHEALAPDGRTVVRAATTSSCHIGCPGKLLLLSEQQAPLIAATVLQLACLSLCTSLEDLTATVQRVVAAAAASNAAAAAAVLLSGMAACWCCRATCPWATSTPTCCTPSLSAAALAALQERPPHSLLL
jgi:hypothetical protein